jgi:hypothetical protein
MCPSALPGYSGTPLIKKLGIKPAMSICVLNAPAGYHEWLKPESSLKFHRSPENASLIHLFADSSGCFYTEMEKLKPVIQKNPSIVIWVSWYKKSSGIKTDMSEDLIREYALSTTLVDIKVCAVTSEWSGLKLMVRKRDR